jgi:DNA-binding transcriptional LysR family regulator
MPTSSHIGNYYVDAALFVADMPINHRQVELFRAVMQAGSLSGAAQALHSSQPTLSRELGRMESRLGYALFERSAGSRLKPTAAAQSLWESVQRHYQGLGQVQAQARQLALADAQQLQLLALPALAHALLPSALARWPEREQRVAITPAESPLLEAWMAEQRFDLAVTERTGPVSGCVVEPLAELAEVAVLPAGHALLARSSLRPQDFAGEAFISLADDDPYRSAIDGLFADAGVQRQLRLQTHSAVAACALVAQGLGVTIVNPFTALACAGPALHWRHLSVRIPYALALLRPLHRPSRRGTDGLAQALRDEAARLGDDSSRASSGLR